MSTSQNSSNAAQVTASISGKDLQLAFNRSKEQEPEFKDLFWHNWDSRILNYDSLNEMLGYIERESNGFEYAHTSIHGIDEWFNAYLCSDEFGQEKPETKQRIIKSKEAVTWLLNLVNEFMADNQIGVYSRD